MDAVSADAPAHVVGHDWGSIQSWGGARGSHGRRTGDGEARREGTVSVMADDPTTPIAGEPVGASTLLEALEQLRAKGFDRDMFITADAMVRCGSCHHDMAPTELNLVRLEGVSDPGEEAAVLALECTMCHARGTVVVRFGPEASPQDDAVLLAVSDQR